MRSGSAGNVGSWVGVQTSSEGDWEMEDGDSPKGVTWWVDGHVRGARVVGLEDAVRHVAAEKKSVAEGVLRGEDGSSGHAGDNSQHAAEVSLHVGEKSQHAGEEFIRVPGSWLANRDVNISRRK